VPRKLLIEYKLCNDIDQYTKYLFLTVRTKNNLKKCFEVNQEILIELLSIKN